MWELRFRKEEYSIRAGAAKGRPFPEWYLDFPEILPGEEFYLIAFWTLSTERQVSQGALGRIPWSRAMNYAVKKGVAPDMLDAFWQIVSTLDAAYLEGQRTEYKKTMDAQKRETKRSRTRGKNYGR